MLRLAGDRWYTSGVRDLIAQHHGEIERLCRTYRVNRLEVFGSSARGDFDPASSDIDFLVEFEELGWKGSFKRYMGLKLDLEALLGRSVDLVEPKAIVNPYFALVANRHRDLVYGMHQSTMRRPETRENSPVL